MIIKNTPANNTFARKAREAINAETGFRALIDKGWNCSADIRIEVGTVNCPFIVITKLTPEKRLELHIRMTQTSLDEVAILTLKYRLESVDKIAARLQRLVEDYHPRLSAFGQ